MGRLIGKFVRIDNKIRMIKATGGYEYFFIEDSSLVYTISEYKIANTPKELVQVGDLIWFNVGDKNRYMIIEDIDDNFSNLTNYVDGNNMGIDIMWVTKILTPNSKGGYDLQWEENNE